MSEPVHMYLVAYEDGRDPKVIRSVSARGAVLGRLKDDEDPVSGVLCVWRLGAFPTQFALLPPGDARELVREKIA